MNVHARNLLRSLNTVSGFVAPGRAARVARDAFLRPRAAAYPVRAWEKEAELGARRVVFRFGLSGLRWGDSGPVVLMLHGWEGRPTQFGALVEPLLAAGRQVVALDAPAHGQSPGEETTLMEYAAAVQEAAVEIPDLESVVGHSMGGAVTAIALSRGLPAQRAVLIASPAAIEAVVRGYADAIGLPGRAAHRFLRLVEDANGVPARELDITRLGSRLQVPALIVHDVNDAAVPFSEGEAIARAWPGARLRPTAGLGHSRILRDFGVIETVTRFLVGRPGT